MKHFPRLVPAFAVCCAIAGTVAFGPASGSRVGAQAVPPPPPAPNATARIPTAAPTLSPKSSPLPSTIPIVSPSGTASGAAATGEPRGRKRGKASATPASSTAPEPSATPTSPAFATLDGTWEVQVQYIDHTDYSYLTIAQATSGAISGSWRVDNKPYAFDGTYDGRLIRMVVKKPAGTVTLSGYVEGASDMVGLVDVGGKTDATAFTAEHRPSSKGSIFKKGI